MKKNPFRTIPNILAITVGVLVVGMAFAFAFDASAFVGPSQAPPSGSSAIGSDSSNNVSVGTSTTISGTKLLVVGASSDSGTNALQVLQNNKTAIFILRDDGSVSIETSTVSAGNTVIGGNLTVGGTISAASGLGASLISAGNVSSGAFGSNSTGGNYSFPASVGIGTTGPGAPLQVENGVNQALTLPISVGNGYYQTGSATGIGFLTDGNPSYTKGALVYASTGEGWNVGNFEFLLRNDHSYSTPVTLADAKMTILNTGNVGIGTTGPNGALTVMPNNGNFAQQFNINGWSPNGAVEDIYLGVNMGGTAGAVILQE